MRNDRSNARHVCAGRVGSVRQAYQRPVGTALGKVQGAGSSGTHRKPSGRVVPYLPLNELTRLPQSAPAGQSVQTGGNR